MVSKVDGSEITIGKKTYMVDDDASITVDGKKADVSKLRSGMRALVNGRVISRGRTTAESLYEATRITARSK